MSAYPGKQTWFGTIVMAALCHKRKPQRLTSAQGQVVPDVELERCLLRLCNLPNYALDRLSRYEAALWRQAGQILFALDNLDRRKPQERMRRFCLGGEQALLIRREER